MPTGSGNDELNQIIAGNLRELRKKRGMSLDDMSEATGVSKSMLGSIERCDSGLSVATLWKISKGLRIPFTTLMKEDLPEAEVMKNTAIPPLSNGQDEVRVYTIFPYEDGRNFEIVYDELDHGAESCSDPHEPGTEEYILVFQGELTLTIGEKVYTVPAGSSIRCQADKPHSYANHGTEQVKLYIVIRYTSDNP